MSEDWVGQTVGSYRIECEIGAGGCGRVYRAVDLMLERPVAIKVLDPRLASQEEAALRFRAEAHTLARLSHPNVAALYSLLLEDGAHLMVMEYVEGVSIDVLVRRRGVLRIDEMMPVFLQVLDGVEYFHGSGVIHRDLKGANVMLRPDGVAKVLDFGIAAALAAGPDGAVLGTPEYMAPEQLRGEAVDARTDLYALGVLLYRALSGRYPGGIAADGEVESTPAPLAELVSGVPGVVSEAVARVLAPDPDDRFASASELRRALDRRGSRLGFAIDLADDGEAAGQGDRATMLLEEPTSVTAASADACEVDKPTTVLTGDVEFEESTGEWEEQALIATPLPAAPEGQRASRARPGIAVWAAAAVLLGLGAGWILLGSEQTPEPAQEAELRVPPAPLPVEPSPPAPVALPQVAPAPEPDSQPAVEPAPAPAAKPAPSRAARPRPTRKSVPPRPPPAPATTEPPSPEIESGAPGWEIRR